jgi:hypothetical protein
MNAKQKVLDRESCEKLAKILEKLGIKLETERVWVKQNEPSIHNPKPEWELVYANGLLLLNERIYEVIPAPDSDELLEIMPANLSWGGLKYSLHIGKRERDYFIYYDDDTCSESLDFVIEESLVQALFEMLIWFAEKGLIGK